MLQSITIKQVALIDECTIEFHDGFQVMTGETGAGKSIVVDSVNLILGGRADRDLIRSGCEKATVEAVFDVPGNEKIRRFLLEEEIDYDGRTVTVYREISRSGKNICRVCGVLLPIGKLRTVASFLMDVHGQSEHQFLTDPELHLSFLDQNGDEQHQELLEKTKKACEEFLDSHRAYAALVKRGKDRDERMAALEKSIAELRKANIKAGEKSKLTEERKALQAAAEEAAKLQEIEVCLSGEDAEGNSSLSKIKTAAGILKGFTSGDEKLSATGERCEALYFELEEIAYEISTLLSRAEASPEKLERIDSRLEQIRKLERKFNADAEELGGMLESLTAQYEELNEIESRINEAAKEHKELLIRYRNIARELTASREKLAADFEARMTGELKQLGMENTRFKVVFKENDTGKPLMPTESGDDRIEFMISPNPGEPLKPLAKIASGGELSRLMLAVKTLEAAHTGVESMVFDEIDTGISGRMAQVVAEKMITISGNHQVICVTHLPQIAAAADDQFLVQKAVSAGRTNTSVICLDQAGREEEVARMISGADGITEQSIGYAAGMMKAAAELKEQRIR